MAELCARDSREVESDIDSATGGIFSEEKDKLAQQLEGTSNSEMELW